MTTDGEIEDAEVDVAEERFEEYHTFEYLKVQFTVS